MRPCALQETAPSGAAACPRFRLRLVSAASERLLLVSSQDFMAAVRHYLEFERPIADLEAKSDELSQLSETAGGGNFDAEIDALRARVLDLRREAYARLDPWQKTQVARHPERPHFMNYVAGLITDFVELRGARTFGDAQDIVGGLDRFCCLFVV